MESLEGSRVP